LGAVYPNNLVTLAAISMISALELEGVWRDLYDISGDLYDISAGAGGGVAS